MSQKPLTRKIRQLILVLVCLTALGAILGSLLGHAYGANLPSRSLQLSDSTPSAVATYNFSFVLPSLQNMGSVEIQFCSNDPLQGDVCDPPTGLDATSAVLADQTGVSNYTIGTGSDANKLIIVSPQATAASDLITMTFNNITNPDSPGSYFARIQTFSSIDTSGSYSDFGGIAFSIESAINVTATVPPYILFCTGITIPNDNCTDATGDYIDFGQLSTISPGQGTSQMLAATNAASGYNISVYGTTLTSGVNTIPSIPSSDVSRPGTAQFGFNLRANTSPSGGLDPSGNGSGAPLAGYSTQNFYQFNSGDNIASYIKPDYDRLYTASYIVNVPPTQSAGVYVSTLTYICVATF
ncbi:MAG TPA: hypothetical protein VIH90_00310 [Candidatus Saccharimonadales bacterium]